MLPTPFSHMSLATYSITASSVAVTGGEDMMSLAFTNAYLVHLLNMGTVEEVVACLKT
jgi:hypothetical protein